MNSYRINLQLAKAGKEDVFLDGKYELHINKAIEYYNQHAKDEISIYKSLCEKRSIVLFVDSVNKIEVNTWLRKLRGFTMYLLKNTDITQYVVNTRLWSVAIDEIEHLKKILTYNINGCGFSSSMLEKEKGLPLKDSFGSYYNAKNKIWDVKKLGEVGYSIDSIKENLYNIKRVIEVEDPNYFILQEYQLQYEEFLEFKGYKIFNTDRYDIHRDAANRVRLFIKSDEAKEFEPLEGIIKNDYRSRNVVACINHKAQILIIGVDMPIGGKYLKDKQLDQSTWEEVETTSTEYIEKGYKVIIAGDFNAHCGLKSEYRKEFEAINNRMLDMVPSDIITFIPGRTNIDHILISWNQKKNINIKPYFYTDHVMITSMLKI